MSKINEIEKLGLTNIGKVHYNLSYEELFDHEVKNGEGRVTSNGTFSVDTGIFTGRSPKDKYFVDQEPSNKYIAWGKMNQKISKEVFDELFAKVKQQLSGKDIYVQDAYSGGSLASRKSIEANAGILENIVDIDGDEIEYVEIYNMIEFSQKEKTILTILI